MQSNTVSYQTQSIATENKVIGHVPHSGGFYVPATGDNHVPANAEEVARMMDGNFRTHERNGLRGLDNLRPEEIRADVPKRGLLGGLSIENHDRETKVGPGLVGSIAGGAAIGAVTGVAGGVLLNVLRKTL